MEVSPANGGTVEVDEATASSDSITLTLATGKSVRLEAVPAPGYSFEGWSGSLSGNTNPTTITIDCNKKVTAKFSGVTHLLTIKVDGKGSTSPSGSRSYAWETAVSITATPDAGWRFDGWTGDVADRQSATTVITMNSDKTIIASFYEAKTSWWLIGSVTTAVIVAATVWLAGRARRV